MLMPQLLNLNQAQNDGDMMNVQNTADDFDKIEVSFEDIYNKNETANMKDLLTCPICLNILMFPVQCNKCNKCFCKMCIDNYANSKSICPFRCDNPLYNPNKFVENVLAILQFKCKNGCDKIIKYEELQKHYQEDCDKIDFKAKYKELLKKYKELKNKNNINNPFNNARPINYPPPFQINPHQNPFLPPPPFHPVVYPYNNNLNQNQNNQNVNRNSDEFDSYNQELE